MIRLIADGIVTECVPFGPRTFTYSVRLDDKCDDEYGDVTASLEPYGIHVVMPRATAESWHNSPELGLYSEMPAQQEGGSNTLKVLLEKDLHCLKPRNSPLWEDESDAFPNPNTTCGG